MYNNGQNKDATPKTEYFLNKFSDTPEAVAKFIELLQWKYNPDSVKKIPLFQRNVDELQKIYLLTKWDLEMILARKQPMISLNNREYDKIRSEIKALLEENRQELTKE